jgi:outer membrane immunogenic protein
MRKLLLTTSALVAMVGSASAADLARRPPPPPLPPAPVYNWNGFYIGAMGGYGWSNRLGLSVAGFDFSTSSNDLRGGFAGGTVGYNYQPVGTPVVLGIEVEAAWADIKASRSAATLGTVATVEDKIDAFGTVTGRLGYAWGPALLYAKGGYAWADNRVTASLTTLVPPVVLSASESHIHSGWTVGGGFEYLFAPNWSGKVEYMYADYGSATYGAGLVPGGFGLRSTVNTIKGGINYHFDWGPGPLVARY